MTPLALPLIVISAVMHALWNLLAKRAQSNSATLVFLFAVCESVFFFPIIIIVLQQLIAGNVSWLAIIFMVGSGLLHTLYFWLLSMGYRVGDLSIVYPVARGMGPLLATIGAILLFAERPEPIVFIGSLVIVGGVIILTGDPRSLLNSKALPAIRFGVLTGFIVAAYTLWDAYAMNQVAIAPLMFQGGLSFSRMLLLLPIVGRKPAEIREAWAVDRWKIVGIALLSSLAYLIILFVLTFTPVSYVAPMRTLSILIGVLLGANLLKEKDMKRRVVAAIAIIIGVILLNLG